MATKETTPPSPVPPVYGKGDFRRILIVLAAISELQVSANELKKLEKRGASSSEIQAVGASLVRIVERTGLDNKTVHNAIRIACAQTGVHIEQTNFKYQILDWGPLLSPHGARLALTGDLVGTFVKEGEVE
jgi:hypothetical protein